MEKLVEWMVLAGENEVLGENLPRRHFVHRKPHLPDPGRRGGTPATNRFSYGAATRSFLALFLTFETKWHIPRTFHVSFCNMIWDKKIISLLVFSFNHLN
jgi:hypothetical protein